MTIAIDASSPSVVTATGQGTATTSSFSPPANSLVLVLANSGWSAGGTVTMTVSDSGSNTWTNPVIAAGVTTDGGVSAVYYHYFVTAPGSMTVSVAYAGWGSGGGGRQVAVLVLIGAASNQAAGATAKLLATTGTTGTVSITTTTTGSWVFGASSDVISNDSWTANASTQADNNYSDSTDLVTLVAWDALALTTTPGATTLGGTWGVSTESNQCAFEVLPKTAFIATQPLILTAAAVRKAYY